MLKLITEIDWYIDYIFGYMSTHPSKLPYYHSYMYKKWGNRYCSEQQFQEYWDQIPDE